MLPCQLKYAGPVKFAPGAVDDMRNIRSIEALTSRNEKLGSQKFLRGQDSGWHSINHRRLGPLNPGILDHNHAITHACNQVDKKTVSMSLRKPYWIAHLAFKSS